MKREYCEGCFEFREIDGYAACMLVGDSEKIVIEKKSHRITIERL